MAEYTDFESWKAAGIAAGLSGPDQVQGKDMWTFGTWSVIKTGHGGAWTGTRGEIASIGKSGRPSLNTPRGPALNLTVPHSSLQPAKKATLNT
jgi:hypothetical protein